MLRSNYLKEDGHLKLIIDLQEQFIHHQKILRLDLREDGANQ
jgi:hypothetical protein